MPQINVLYPVQIVVKNSTWPMMLPLPRRQQYAVLMVSACRHPLPPLHVAAMQTTVPQRHEHSLSLLPAGYHSLSCSLFFNKI
jgi:hypothetical protein